ncbi:MULTISPECIES: SDH family Clp fold serine proteinase [Shewanella]|uniref:Serine dehydrogenasease n=1 Tax=Shewanella scandinavica TaxID=3063538 RepID=A0ABU3G3I7_9GAMM|nr:serine dehydrogenasease [Shewanella sp. SP2S1-2]MDT3282204.1 serine dehydrogenasease [Shewanella sp. SP2S1-2]
MSIVNGSVDSFLRFRLESLQNEHFPDSDVIVYYGPIEFWSKDLFRRQLEACAANEQKEKLLIILQTGGGSAETVEKMVEMSRHFYQQVNFLVPDVAMSAGTIWCMSGDKIYMDYSSSLGPIDPQVLNNEKKWVPALGYLDKCNELIQKSASGTPLCNAELVMLNSLDLASLRNYEQARDLSVSLLKKWLVDFKFKDWRIHRSDGPKKEQPVTVAEKEERASEIAKMLSDNNRWHSHGRMIGIKTLQRELKLEIDDYTQNNSLRESINMLHDFCSDYIHKMGRVVLVCSKYGVS